MASTLLKSNKKINKALFYSLIILLLSIGLLSYGVYWAFFDMNNLPVGEFIAEETSPDGTYTVKAYRSSGGATTDFAIRGELVFNNEKGKTKNIYWNYHESTATIKWMDYDTVVINGHYLHVPQDYFDYRNQ